jgi:hypothetical protein
MVLIEITTHRLLLPLLLLLLLLATQSPPPPESKILWHTFVSFELLAAI